MFKDQMCREEGNTIPEKCLRGRVIVLEYELSSG